MWLKLLIFTAALGVFAMAAMELGAMPPDNKEKIAQILNKKELWGSDFPKALARLGSWGETGETRVAVLTNQIVGTTPFRKPQDVQPKTTAMAQAMSKPRLEISPMFEALLGSVPDEMPKTFKPEIVTYFGDDDSSRLVWKAAPGDANAPPPQFLKKDLTVKTLHELLGAPESKPEQKIIESARGERRPTILTLHKYADGAIVFAESNYAKPGIVNRAILDVPAVSAVVFKQK